MRSEVRLIWDEGEIAGWQWRVLVEMYPHIKKRESVRRAYEATFTPQEQDDIAVLYDKFRRWMFRTGAPNEHEASLAEVALIQRAVAFFGTL